MTLTLNDSHSGNRGGAQFCNIVNESGMYSLVLTSRKPEAKAFKKWLTSEVIPAIRKTGSYVSNKISCGATSEELIVQLAIQNLETKKKVVDHEKRLSFLEDKVLTETKEITYPVQQVVISDDSAFISVKEIGNALGLNFVDGISQGIGRSASSRCRKLGIDTKDKLVSPNGTSTIRLYPKDILREILTKKGYI